MAAIYYNEKEDYYYIKIGKGTQKIKWQRIGDPQMERRGRSLAEGDRQRLQGIYGIIGEDTSRDKAISKETSRTDETIPGGKGQ